MLSFKGGHVTLNANKRAAGTNLLQALLAEALRTRLAQI